MWNSEGSRRVLRAAACSRLLLLSLICLWRLLLHPYDTSAGLNPACLPGGGGEAPPGRPAPRWPRVGSAIERSVVWDGVYFVRIAECGYEYEQSYAFFPALPMGILLLSRSAFAPLVPIIGYRAVLALSGYVLSNVAFLFAAVYFYELSVLILKDATVAFRASILFCFNPASVFYSSIYSESLYALFSLGGLHHLFSGSNIIAMLLLALSGSTRSNGVLNAGYFCFQAMYQAYDALSRKQPALAAKDIIAGIMQSMFVFGPFVAFQAYGFINICMGSTVELRPWCKTRIPRVYDYIQSHYWNVGFLRYFQVKQLPNFLLASPIILLAICSIIEYVRLRPEVVFSLGFQASIGEKRIAGMLYQRTKSKPDVIYSLNKNASSNDMKGNLMLRQRKCENKQSPVSSHDEGVDEVVLSHAKEGFSSILVLPFIYHLAFMTTTAFFVMHVQFTFPCWSATSQQSNRSWMELQYIISLKVSWLHPWKYHNVGFMGIIFGWRKCGCDPLLVSQSPNLLVRCIPTGQTWHLRQKIESSDLGVFCSFHSFGQLALLKLLPFHVRSCAVLKSALWVLLVSSSKSTCTSTHMDYGCLWQMYTFS